jgi:hypothetical protein
MQNGFIYPILNWIIHNMKYLTIVELFKWFSILIVRKFKSELRTSQASRIAVDVFILLKWIFIIFVSKCHLKEPWVVFATWYLILTNLYSYFYYHIWEKESLNAENFLIDRIRRRFLNLMLAIGFSNLCFAYLYGVASVHEFIWTDRHPSFLEAIWYSISNSLASNYDGLQPLTETAEYISKIQLMITFVFLSIILGKSIPQTNSVK